MPIPLSKNPLYNYNINPLRNYSINPLRNYSINPLRNYSINPLRNYSINPLRNYSINPLKNFSINPFRNYSINPLYNLVLNPLRNLSLSPNHNDNIDGWYRYDKTGMYQGFTVNTNENTLLLEYDKNMNLLAFWVKRGSGYSIFSWGIVNYIGYAESDGATGYNIFDLNGTWIGYLK